VNSVNVAIENLSASESRIRDTDMAQEMMSFTRSQTLSQAGTSMLSQADQSQQGVLSLLR
jgi:flagellin